MILAFTGLALGLGASFTAAASSGAFIGALAGAVADVALVAASAYSAYSSAQAQRANAKTQAAIQRKQAEAYGMQAADLERQAGAADAKAGIAQIQAEQEAERRSRILAADIGSTYANFAGNGLLVDVGSTDDTFANVLKTTVGEAQGDIQTIRDNARMSVWDYQSDARSLLTSARTSRISAATSLLGAAASEKNAKYYKRASWLDATTAGLSTGASAVSAGFAGASYAKSTGK